MFLSLICGILFVYVAAVTGNRRNGAFDKSVNMFSDEGELLQVKYARNAGLQGGSVVCATSSSNDLLVCIPNQPELPVLLDRRSVDKISKVDDEIWFAFSGLAGDGRALISQARKYCIEYRSQFGCSPTGRSVASVVSQLQHDSTVSGNRRPFGVQLLIFSFNSDSNQFEIYQCEPSGEFSRWFAAAIGQNSLTYTKDLERDWKKSMSSTEVLSLLTSVTDKAAASLAAETSTSETSTPSKAVHRVFYRLHKSKPDSKASLSFYPSPDELLATLERRV